MGNWTFSSFVPIFPLIPPKNLEGSPHKNYIFKIKIDRSIISQSLEFWSWKLWIQEAFEIGLFLTTFLQEMAKKNTWWLNGRRGYHASAISLILTFREPE